MSFKLIFTILVLKNIYLFQEEIDLNNLDT